MRHVLCLFLKRRLTQTLQATEGLKPPRLSEESRFLLERPLPPCRRVAERSRSSRSSRSSKKKELTCDTCFIVLWLWLFSEAGPAPDGALNALRAALRKVHGLSSCTAFLRARCAGIFYGIPGGFAGAGSRARWTASGVRSLGGRGLDELSWATLLAQSSHHIPSFLLATRSCP